MKRIVVGVVKVLGYNMKEKVIKIISEQLGKQLTDSELETPFEDLGADSLDVVEIAMSIEDEFNFEIPDELAENVKNVNDIIKIVEQLVS